MAFKMTGERLFIQEFIKVYSSLPALWDTSLKEYYNRLIKNEQYDMLVEKYRERFPEADREEVKKKINSLRSNFRKELRRVKEAAETGEECETPSKLWYYEEMRFLENLEPAFQRARTNRPKPKPTRNNNNYNLYSVDFDCDPDDYEGNGSDIDEGTLVVTPVLEEFEGVPPGTPPKKKTKKSVSVERIEFSSKRSHQPDEYDTIAAAWAVELRKMEPSQVIFAKKAIHDILFEGQLGTLHRESVSINKFVGKNELDNI